MNELIGLLLIGVGIAFLISWGKDKLMSAFVELRKTDVKRAKYYIVGICGYTYGMYSMTQKTIGELASSNGIMAEMLFLIVVIPLLYIGYRYWDNNKFDDVYKSNNEH